MNKKRLGRFKISSRLIVENRKSVQAVFSKVIPVRAEHLWAEDVVEYFAVSDCFDEVGLTEFIPEYTVMVKETEDGSSRVWFEKCEPKDVVETPTVRSLSRR
jgi:hypothetical protein